MSTKPRLFIGSSSEEIGLAKTAKQFLETKFDVVIWNYPLWEKGVFKLNNNFLSDLLKTSLLFDYVLMIGTTDDKVEYRGKEVFAARDNVIFELGLFLGRMGISKCAFLIDWKLNNDPLEFSNALKTVAHFFDAAPTDEINFFPSSTLASVYYENFILPVCSYYVYNGGFIVRDKLYEECLVNIIMPEQINTDVNIQFEQLKRKVKTEQLIFHYNGRPRSIQIDIKEEHKKLQIIDFPTVISGINYSILHLLPEEFHAQSESYQLILQRELKRFTANLLLLIKKGGFNSLVCLKKEREL
jgi:hypothetical protein